MKLKNLRIIVPLLFLKIFIAKAQATEPFIGQISYVAFNFAPVGWADCDGRSMLIKDNETLFSLIGTTFGGDGITTFNLPNIQGRVLIGSGTSDYGTPYNLSQTGGSEVHKLIQNEMPLHSHSVNSVSTKGTQNNPMNGFPADSQILDKKYAGSGTTPLENMSPLSISPMGDSQPHNNMQPYITFKCIIAIEGYYPSFQ